ncbi:MAG: LysR family transcriptional regulator [Lachnospiraceae bacterium]|nr:LysR family transcriptional regulator [Lachnospiraceae bacterium]
MTHGEIEAFCEVVRYGSISAAAQHLFISQPALGRRIHALEEELGYSLMNRKKGQRTIQLTEEGKAFINIANKWLNVWEEAQSINKISKNNILNISSVGSVSTYILPLIFHNFSTTNSDVRICFHNYHSFEAYQYVASHLVDLAFVSDDMFHEVVETIPAFKEPMVLLANIHTEYTEIVHPSQLNPENEIRLPWNPEYDMWHDFWFKPFSGYKMFLDQMSLLEFFLLWKDTWAIVPASVAYNLQELEYAKVYKLMEPPPERIIYYLKNGNSKINAINEFLSIMNNEIQKIPNVKSFINL